MKEQVAIVATEEDPMKVLEMRIAELEGQIHELMANAATATGRKTAQSFAASTKLKDGVAASAVDDAMKCLSVEQRIAVKMEMLRSGLIG